MRAVVQRVKEASVTISGEIISEIQQGYLILLGIEAADTQEDINWLSNKIIKLRVFGDEKDAMNRSIIDINGQVIVVSQFTLHASTKKGNRPSFMKAAPPEIALSLYQSFIIQLEKDIGKKVGTGKFGAMMDVALINDGPVTILFDTKNKE